MGGRYRAGHLPKGHPHAGEYGIRDTVLKTYVNRWGEPDPDYWAVTADVAKMRSRDLNQWDRERSAR
jgi:hypothetical protein